MEGLLDGQGDLLSFLDQEAVFRDRHHDPTDVGLLEGVSADGGSVDLPGDRHERSGIHVGVADRGDQVRRPGAGCGDADPDPAARDRVALSGVPATLFVAHQDVPDPRVEQRVVRGKDRSSGNAEGHFYPGAFKRLDERLRARQQLAVCPGHRSPFGLSPELLRSTKNPRRHLAREGASRCWIETLSDDYELTGGHAPRIAGGPEAVKQGGPRVLNGETHPTRPIPANARSALCPQTSPPHLPQSSRKFSAWFPITSLTTHRRNPEPQSPLESFHTIHSTG